MTKTVEVTTLEKPGTAADLAAGDVIAAAARAAANTAAKPGTGTVGASNETPATQPAPAGKPLSKKQLRKLKAEADALAKRTAKLEADAARDAAAAAAKANAPAKPVTLAKPGNTGDDNGTGGGDDTGGNAPNTAPAGTALIVPGTAELTSDMAADGFDLTRWHATYHGSPMPPRDLMVYGADGYSELVTMADCLRVANALGLYAAGTKHNAGLAMCLRPDAAQFNNVEWGFMIAMLKGGKPDNKRNALTRFVNARLGSMLKCGIVKGFVESDGKPLTAYRIILNSNGLKLARKAFTHRTGGMPRWFEQGAVPTLTLHPQHAEAAE